MFTTWLGCYLRRSGLHVSASPECCAHVQLGFHSCTAAVTNTSIVTPITKREADHVHISQVSAATIPWRNQRYIESRQGVFGIHTPLIAKHDNTTGTHRSSNVSRRSIFIEFTAVLLLSVESTHTLQCFRPWHMCTCVLESSTPPLHSEEASTNNKKPKSHIPAVEILLSCTIGAGAQVSAHLFGDHCCKMAFSINRLRFGL
jgi:hypothetical protein